ncbi:MAG: FAD-binding oxidoreductase [Alphaproteobacteria bacterium]|nr:FAD-binding oxidoreductase [Alphaproteobacteria bacterium]
MPSPDRVPSDPQLPARVDVVVIGGGIIGASTALALAQKGVSVALCEKGEIGAEQSGRNWGWARIGNRDPREIPLMIESKRLWRTMNETVEGETGYRRPGVMYLCETEADVARYEKWVEHAKHYQLDHKVLSSDEVAALLPGATRRWPGAIYSPSDGRAEPQKAAPAIAIGARRNGAAVLTNCAVRGIETQGGRVSGVVTEKGRIDCGSVVLAGGAWSRLFCGNLGIELPALKVRASVLRTAPVEGAPEQGTGGRGFAFRKRLDGGYTVANRGASTAEIVPDSFRLFFQYMPALRAQWKDLRLRVGGRFLEELRTPRRWSLDAVSPFEKTRILDPEPDNDILDEAYAMLTKTFPVFAGVEILDRWAGMIDVTPDVVPVIGPVSTTPGFFIASGFSGHGFGIGPGAGRLMADLVTGTPTLVDPKPFRLERFSDGSPIVIH